MTPEQIDKMEAGREMDALIAEKVMGLNVKPIFRPKNELKFMPGFVWHYEDTWEYPEIKDYSTEIAEAWEVVEKLKLWIWRDEQGNICSGKPEYDDYYNKDRIDTAMKHSAIAETAPLAICRAALKAVIK
jgi:hypothetical protein